MDQLPSRSLCNVTLYNQGNGPPHARKALCFARCLGGTYRLIQGLGLTQEPYKTILFSVGVSLPRMQK